MEKVANFVKGLVQGELNKGDIDSFIACLKIGLLDFELKELRDIANRQIAYIHPLKRAQQIEQNNLGHHNLAVLKLLNRLRNEEKTGQVLEDIKEKCRIH